MKINNETKIGVMVAIVIAILVGLTIKTGNFNFSKEGYPIKVRFQNVEGITQNSPVMFNGFEVGVVQNVDIIDVNDKIVMELTLMIKKDVKIRQGVEARVKNLGFMGEKYIGLSSVDKKGDYIKSGTIIQGKEPVDFGKILESGDDIAKNIKSITDNLDQRLEVNKGKIDQILSNMDATLKNTNSISKNIDERLTTNKEAIDEVVAHLQILSSNLEEMSYDLKMNPWKLLYRPKGRK